MGQSLEIPKPREASFQLHIRDLVGDKNGGTHRLAPYSRAELISVEDITLKPFLKQKEGTVIICHLFSC